MKKINLLLAIHSHQPVGNFDRVFQEGFQKAYLPFIETISRYPNIKFSLHYSGVLLDWLEKNHPDFLERIKLLIKKNQVEIMTGGYYEPILSLLDEQDAIAQIQLLKNRIQSVFAYEAKGGWLAERVWEPNLPLVFSKAGIEYSIVDDSHFKLVSREPEDLSGYYLCEEQGKILAIFAGSEKLRYLIPFKLPNETIEYLKIRLNNSKTDIAVTFADDGEKFGLWPGTHKWVYEKGWLKNFLEAIEENRSWINTPTFTEYLQNHKSSGRIYLTCASYREMMEWSSGYFRNFFIKYEEANNMLSKMRYVSRKVNRLKGKGKLKLKALRHLYMAQDNDAYWHGVFGGLYLNHLRSAVYSHLIEAENAMDGISSKKENAIEELDFNLDGNKEIILNCRQHKLYLTPFWGGAIFEWDYKPKSVNLTNTIARRFEKYHLRLKEKYSPKQGNPSSIDSIHELKEAKEEGLDKFLFYDTYPRYSLIEHFIAQDSTLNDFIAGNFQEQDEKPGRDFGFKNIKQGAKQKLRFYRTVIINGYNLKLSKTLETGRDLVIDYELENASGQILTTLFGTEFNLSIYERALSKTKGEIESKDLLINDSWNGVKFHFCFDRETRIWHFPVETISESEGGIERMYQELCLFFHWQMNLKPKEVFKTKITIEID